MSRPKKNAPGKLNWLIPGGRIPLASTGHEPEFVSRDQLAILNLNEAEAEVQLVIFHEDDPPVTGYAFKVQPRRLFKFRINDLIDPLPVPLERNYACLLRSSLPVVVQYSGMDTGHRTTARISTMAFPAE
jgi:hypothetical protein